MCRSDKPFINKFEEIPFEQKIGNVTWGRHFWNIRQTFTSLRPFLCLFSADSWMIALIWLLYYSQNKYALAWVAFGNIGDWFQAVCIWLASIESGIYKFEASAVDVDVVVISDICHSKCDNKLKSLYGCHEEGIILFMATPHDVNPSIHVLCRAANSLRLRLADMYRFRMGKWLSNKLCFLFIKL